MKDKRPVNLDISTITMPLAAYTSITHRLSGVIVFAGIAVLLWLLDLSLSSENGFNQMKELLTSPVIKFVTWGILSALAYHMVAGFKHLLMDFGIGETKRAAPIGAVITVLISLIFIVTLGVWIW